jgi:YaiO family outer membrane protein
MIALLAAVLIDVAASPSPSPPPASVQVETGVTHETLTNNRGSWSSEYLRIIRQNADRQTVYAEVSSNTRFGRSDDRVLLGAYLPLGERWMLNAEADASNTHYVLPTQSLSGMMQYASGRGFLEGLGARHIGYDAGSVNSGIFSLEKYWGTYRFSYLLTAADVAGCGTDVEHALEIDRYYGKRDSVFAIGLVTGREVDSVGLPALVTSRVRGWNVRGRHWMNRNWALVYGAGTFAQGSFYTRTGGRLAVDYRF